jgi:serine protease Do
MSKARFAAFGLILAGGIAAAVSGLFAQTARRPDERTRPRVMMLDGRGGQIGVVVEDLDAAGLKAAGGATSGVRLDQVDQDGPAAKAGLREGDIIVEVDGDRVRSARQFSRLIQETADGRAVRLGIVRDGQRQTVEVTPESHAFAFGFDSDRIGRDIARGLRDLEPQLRELEPKLRELEPRWREFRFDGPMDFHFDMPGLLSNPRARLGIGIDELTPQLAEYFGVKDGGVLVSSINRDSAAERAGLKAGDVIVSINGDRVRHADDLIDELRGVEEGEVTIGIVRDKKESTLKATIEESPRPFRRRPA